MSAAPAGASGDMSGATPGAAPGAASAGSYGAGASATVQTLSNSPIPDTPENRAKYGRPLSYAGRHSAPTGN
jgi:hypothetical protein